jgi:S1-C subfamily serine protease
MIVPIDILKPILTDLMTLGRAARPPNAWLGVFATDLDGKVFIVGVYSGAPADRAGLKPGDLIASVGGEKVSSLAGFFRKVWALGPAGTTVPLVVQREGETVEARVTSSQRDKFLKKPRMHS